MPPSFAPSPVEAFLATQGQPGLDPIGRIREFLARANGNISRNTYLALDEQWSLGEAARQLKRCALDGTARNRLALWGLPVALKDCFDLEGFKTSSGSKFYASHRRPAARDSAVAARLKGAGAVIVGKTHLHQLAYGITGENRDYGNCLQPENPARLTGGSSSGAAASIQEGSALAAIGTDTGGSIRVPAAICGLAGYRASHGVADWAGGDHLAPSFDTIGWIFRDLRDAPRLAEALFALPGEPVPEDARRQLRVGILSGPLVEDCDAAVQQSYGEWQDRLRRAGAVLECVAPEFWLAAWEIYAPIQAHEAAKLHAGFYQEFEPAITARLEWGAALGEEEIHAARNRMEIFCGAMRELFRRYDLLLAPATPISVLDAAKDQSEERAHILRLTTPASVAGLPAAVLPSPDCGMQLLAAHNDDRRLLQFAALIGGLLAAERAPW
ncbi:MAG TPA: amidase [Acidobacteriaceae bacterium]|nr:amidase [Acidobacteriaceae bacterium]